jgi:NAD(P)-dependent dehydrogenase (short-subunit alcohol dehydrogenase family)
MSTIAIVGAGPQLGRAIGHRFAREGFDVALIARSRTTIEKMAAELSETGVRAAAFPADVTDRPGLRDALAAAEDHFGTIDVLEYSPGPSAADFAGRPVVDASVAERGVYAAHVAIGAFIGQGSPKSEPDVIADAYWRLHQERSESELFYLDLPENFVFEGVSPQYLSDDE